MKKLSLLLFLIIPFKLFSQECKYEIFEQDEFTKAKVIETTSEKIISKLGKLVKCSYRSYNDDVVFYISIGYSGNDVFSVSKGEELMIKLKNDEIITLKNNEYKISKNSYSRYGSSNTIDLTFDIKKEELSKLASSQISKFRLYRSEDYIEEEINDKGAKLFEQLTKCILNQPVNYVKPKKQKNDDAY